MFRFAAAAAGLAILWAMLRPPLGLADLAVAGVGAVATVLIMHRLGLLRGQAIPMPAQARFWVQGADRRFAAALRVLAAGLSPRPGASSGLVRVRVRAQTPASQAAFAQAAGAAPGLVVVDIDDEALLLHALDEERVDVGVLARLELSAETALGEARP
ncbi:MAG: hypothetical protein GC206_00325 [Alphaproteobacteria bacterium]|nr:hypothetical protein [Alphaproteobacteria bacterium]